MSPYVCIFILFTLKGILFIIWNSSSIKIVLLSDVDCHRYSPASSCHSELVHHMSPQHANASVNGGHQQRAGQGSQPINAASLNTVLSHSFPLAFDSVNPNCRFPVPTLEKVCTIWKLFCEYMTKFYIKSPFCYLICFCVAHGFVWRVFFMAHCVLSMISDTAKPGVCHLHT